MCSTVMYKYALNMLDGQSAYIPKSGRSQGLKVQVINGLVDASFKTKLCMKVGLLLPTSSLNLYVVLAVLPNVGKPLHLRCSKAYFAF